MSDKKQPAVVALYFDEALRAHWYRLSVSSVGLFQSWIRGEVGMGSGG